MLQGIAAKYDVRAGECSGNIMPSDHIQKANEALSAQLCFLKLSNERDLESYANVGSICTYYIHTFP
jgi:hypothetical protein